jgi:hypothetical protein
MRRLILVTVALGTLTACGQYAQGKREGCDAGVELGDEFGCEDALLCLTPDSDPGERGRTPDRWSEGWEDGYAECFPSAYMDSYRDCVDDANC